MLLGLVRIRNIVGWGQCRRVCVRMTCCAIWAGIGIENNWLLLLSFCFYCCLSSTQWQILQSFIVTVVFRTTVQSSVINQAFFGLFTFCHYYQDWLHFPPLINTLETYLASAQVLQVCTICFNQILMAILQKRQIISTTTLLSNSIRGVLRTFKGLFYVPPILQPRGIW